MRVDFNAWLLLLMMLNVCWLIGFASARLAACMPIKLINAMAIIVVLALVYLVKFARDPAWLVYLFPIQDLVFVATPIPLLGSMLAGLVFSAQRVASNGQPDEQPLGSIKARWRSCRQLLPTSLLAGFVLTSLLAPYFGITPACREVMRDGVCIQSTNTSCSPAAAVTLLKMKGIDANEQQLADWCLTTKHGTSWLGLFRGIKLATRHTDHRVVAKRLTLDELLASGKPAILKVNLPASEHKRTQYESESGWLADQPHTVLFLSHSHQQYLNMVDPEVGRENWTIDDLRTLWTGDAIWIE